MISLVKGPVLLAHGRQYFSMDEGAERINARLTAQGYAPIPERELEETTARRGTMAYGILSAHNQSGEDKKLRLRFDSLASHDITYVGIVQTARASGLEKFPVPYVLTNCHNSLCAVGGTINEDDHRFGLSAAEKFGGIFVPAHFAIIHQYMREMMSGCGRMILGSDSHTRYGALGTMAIGEGGPELVKQILEKTYDIPYPEVVGVYLKGSPKPGVGPMDVSLAIIGAVFKNGFAKNKVMEFVGEGIASLSADYRIGIDVMTTETTCLSSIWETDDTIQDYYKTHKRPGDYKKLSPERAAIYDGMIVVELDKIEPMIAMPFHPSNVYTIRELNENTADILALVEREGQKQLDGDAKLVLRDKMVDGRLRVQQGVVVGCAGGTFENIMAVSRILQGRSIGNGHFDMSVYPASQPVFMEALRCGAVTNIMQAGSTFKTAFCGPCFGAGDVPPNNALSVRHVTRNFPNREGSKPGEGQMTSIAMMDARSVAATAVNQGFLTPATELGYPEWDGGYTFDDAPYKSRVYQGYSKEKPETELVFGPNIASWPEIPALAEHMLLKVASVILDPVTTTDELIPSGETSSYRSNPLRLAEYTLSRKDPGYVGRAKAVAALEKARTEGSVPDEVKAALAAVSAEAVNAAVNTGVTSVVYAVRPGDGSAREQAASCQRVLGGGANIALEYATKRYRSNLINWGMVPFLYDGEGSDFLLGGYIYVPHIREAIASGAESVDAKLIQDGQARDIRLGIPALTPTEREIILRGCLINYYAAEMK